MTHDELKELLWDINSPSMDEPELACCQNPQCLNTFSTTDEYEMFCPECRRTLSALEMQNLRYWVLYGC